MRALRLSAICCSHRHSTGNCGIYLLIEDAMHVGDW